MAGSAAAMVITDPPYNVRIASVQGRGRIKHRNFGLAAGEMSAEQFTLFLRTTIALLIEHSRSGSIHFVCMDWKPHRRAPSRGEAALRRVEEPDASGTRPMPARGAYRSQARASVVFKNGSAPTPTISSSGRTAATRSNVWDLCGRQQLPRRPAR